MKALLLVVIAAASLTVGCATARFGPPTVALRITTNVSDATVWIDDHLIGRALDFPKEGKRLVVGFHRIEIRAAGHYSLFQEVDAKAGTDVAIRADLHELLP